MKREVQDMILRKQLKKKLIEHGLTASELSRKTGVARQVISDWLAGVKPRNIEAVKTVADHFKISVDELCFGSWSEAFSEAVKLRSESTSSDHAIDADMARDTNSNSTEAARWSAGIYEIRFRRIK